MQIPGMRSNLLTYCTNIHAGESWTDVINSLRSHLPTIKNLTSPGESFGIGLRLGSSACAELLDPSTLEEFQNFLRTGNYYVPTINGFPFGPFHGQPVKENVYAPDWTTVERTNYTNQLAQLLPELMGDQDFASISTVPGSFKGWVTLEDNDKTTAITRNLMEHLAHLIEIKQRTGKTIALALEPEPCCMLETIDETVRFFKTQIFSRDATTHLSNLTGLSLAAAEDAIRQHIGVCYDVCHAAVEFEDPRESIKLLLDAEIAIPKVQLSSALRIVSVQDNIAELLERFVEPVYLHQVLEKTDSEINRYLDIPMALAEKNHSIGNEWRIHFHVPVFLNHMEKFDTTQFFLKEILELYRESPFSPHLEVETYTWDVLPEQYRDGNIANNIARELNWVKEELSA